MAAPTSLSSLLDSLTSSLASALEATPRIAGIEPPPESISLLDVKNELLLSYLQNLVFLILLKIRNAKAKRGGVAAEAGSSDDDDDDDADGSSSSDHLSDAAVVRKLVELRLYLDKGVRPLEEKLNFRIDMILRTAEEAERKAKQQPARARGHKAAVADASGSEAGGSDEERDSDSDSDSDSNDDDDNDDEGESAPTHSAKPGLSNFARVAAPTGMAAAALTQDKTGIYRPPRFAPTVMPGSTPLAPSRRDQQRRQRPLKSATLDEYVRDELEDAAPRAAPSVGTDLAALGRRHKTQAERDGEDRRREYEETNFVRLPKESKKERAKRSKTEGRSAKVSFGGEDWRDLGEGVDRIARLTRGGGGGGSSSSGARGTTKALLDKSRKRGRETTDSARGSGFSEGTREMGDRFNKKLKVMEGGRRNSGRR
ncbi:hypothetical protein GGR56DRAFT_322045 [Xylariaceae sp. FL0804]|nr:hypothetical protein GGR56DRAFT_322045 [Xylariaceae sp. FL0804]